jgi:signal transduction histidine kinase
MKALIEDLLELERLGEKSFPLAVQPVESRDLLEDAVTDAQPLADAKHISLVLDLSDPPKIDADPHRISQVLSNLIGNAIKFTPEGGTVTLRARPRDGTLSVTIADTGPGIAPEDLAHGLGLYIARGIVEAHGGRVWAESSPQGATFVFTLPLETRRD